MKNKSPGPGGLCTFIEDTAGNVPWYTKPIGAMYGIFTNIYHKNQLNVGEYTIHHGSYGKKTRRCDHMYKTRFQTSGTDPDVSVTNRWHTSPTVGT